MNAETKRIVVAYDDPESKTLERAADLAETLGAELVVANVVVTGGAADDDAAAYARGRLDQAREYLEQRGATADYVAPRGSPAEAIVSLARDRNADLIVIGTRKKKFLERLVEGSVNREVLNRAPCDVLVVY